MKEENFESGFYKALINPKEELDKQELWREGLYSTLREEYDIPVGDVFYFGGLFGRLADTTMRETNPSKIKENEREAILESLTSNGKEKRVFPVSNLTKNFRRLNQTELEAISNSPEYQYFKSEIKAAIRKSLS